MFLKNYQNITSETLFYAIAGSNLNIINACSSQVTDFKQALVSSIIFSNTELFQRYIVLYPSENILKLAVEYENAHATLYALEHGQSDESYVFVAVKKGYFSILQLMLLYHSNSLMFDERGLSPIHYAAIHNHTECAKLLNENGSPIDIVSNTEKEVWTPLMFAARWGSISVAKFLVENGANVNYIDKEGNTALHLAVQCGCEPIVKMLVENGANTQIENREGKMPIHVAFRYGYFRLIPILQTPEINQFFTIQAIPEHVE